MEPIVIYPGSFCPPTYGHCRLVERTAALFPQVHVVCSDNPFKQNRWFSPIECQELWQSYHLPPNVILTTFEAMAQKRVDIKQVILVRGLRNRGDFEEEKRVLEINFEKLGIVHYLHTLSEPDFQDISSSRVREASSNLELARLGRMVSPLVITRLLEKVLEVKNLFLVVGKPASGKSTFLKILEEKSSDNLHINTDVYSEILQPLIQSTFPDKDPLRAFLEEETKFREVIKNPWIKLLKESLQKARGKRNVFVEAAYGLREDSKIFPLVGGKILYFGCGDGEDNQKRVVQRGTPEHLGFISIIPGKEESGRIARENRLRIHCIDTNGDVSALRQKALGFLKILNTKGISYES